MLIFKDSLQKMKNKISLCLIIFCKIIFCNTLAYSLSKYYKTKILNVVQSCQINNNKKNLTKERLKIKWEVNLSHLAGLSLLFSCRKSLLASSELQGRIAQSGRHWNAGGNSAPFFLLLCHTTCSQSLLDLWLGDGHWDLQLQMPRHCLELGGKGRK